jgi:hypothetical protein
MDREIERIAILRITKLTEKVSDDTKAKLVQANGMARGGQQEALRLKISLESCEERCRITARVWVELLEKRNGGYLTQENVTFIGRRVRAIADASKHHIRTNPNRPKLASTAAQIDRCMDRVIGAIGQDLELKLLEYRAFPPKEKVVEDKGHVSINIHHAANVNFGQQIGNINASLNTISEHGDGDLAEVIVKLSEMVASAQALQRSQKEEALQVLAEIAKQAETRPESRSKVTLKALVAHFPTIVATAADLTALWTHYVPLISKFFGL